MIKLLKLLSEIDISHSLKGEEPSFYDNENEVINNYVNKLKQLHPGGIESIQVIEDMEDYSVHLQLKVLIELAKRKLLNFSRTNIKMRPQDVLSMYGNPKDILKNTNFNLNEKFS